MQTGHIISSTEGAASSESTSELKISLEEGKAKLQKAILKSVENEQKLIQYEYELNQQKNQKMELENLLRLRDSLINVLKSRKDEIVMENESLQKYSEEVRRLLLEVYYYSTIFLIALKNLHSISDQGRDEFKD